MSPRALACSAIHLAGFSPKRVGRIEPMITAILGLDICWAPVSKRNQGEICAQAWSPQVGTRMARGHIAVSWLQRCPCANRNDTEGIPRLSATLGAGLIAHPVNAVARPNASFAVDEQCLSEGRMSR